MSAVLHSDESFDIYLYPKYQFSIFIINNVPKMFLKLLCNKIINFRFLLCLILVPKFFCVILTIFDYPLLINVPEEAWVFLSSYQLVKFVFSKPKIYLSNVGMVEGKLTH